MNRLTLPLLSGIFFGGLLLYGQVQAQLPRQNLSVDELVEALTPKYSATRSLRNLSVQPARVDLIINFDFDSARIQDGSKPQLENLVSAMKQQALESLRFGVEGHTDGKGGDRYNLALSERRAKSVADFLARGGVSADRLVPAGKGYAELLNKGDPYSPENRRVRIVAIDK